MMMNTVNTAIDTANMSVESVFTKITAALRRSTEGVLDAASYLVQFEGREDYPKLKKQLIAEKIIGESTISMYMKIGKCTALYLNIEKLPPSFNSIYHLASLEGKKKGFIEEAIAIGKLDRTTKLDEIRKWGDHKSSDWVAITIDILANTSSEMREKIKTAAIKAAQDLGASVKTVAPAKSSK
jgi:hypothetical protein